MFGAVLCGPRLVSSPSAAHHGHPAAGTGAAPHRPAGRGRRRGRGGGPWQAGVRVARQPDYSAGSTEHGPAQHAAADRRHSVHAHHTADGRYPGQAHHGAAAASAAGQTAHEAGLLLGALSELGERVALVGVLGGDATGGRGGRVVSGGSEQLSLVRPVRV